MLLLLTILLIAVYGMHTIPAETDRVHLDHGMDQWKGDSPLAIYAAALKPYGKRFVDINVSACFDNIFCLHSGTARANGFHYIKRWHRIGRRAMTAAELDRPLIQWKARDVKRWRRTKYKGDSYESKFRPMLLAEMLPIAKARHVVMCIELKSKAFATHAHWAVVAYSIVKASGAKVYPMTLATMRGWGQKLQNFHHAGFEVALLQHGVKKPGDLQRFAPYIDAYWGSWGTLEPALSTF